MYPIRITAALAGLAVALGACGSDEPSGLTRSELIAKANAICKKANTDGAAVQAPASFEDPAVVAAYFDKVAPIVDRQGRELAALTPPDEVKADWQAMIAKERAANKLVHTLARKAHARDQSGFQDLEKVPAASKAFADAASKVGATGCVQ